MHHLSTSLFAPPLWLTCRRRVIFGSYSFDPLLPFHSQKFLLNRVLQAVYLLTGMVNKHHPQLSFKRRKGKKKFAPIANSLKEEFGGVIFYYHVINLFFTFQSFAHFVLLLLQKPNRNYQFL